MSCLLAYLYFRLIFGGFDDREGYVISPENEISAERPIAAVSRLTSGRR